MKLLRPFNKWTTYKGHEGIDYPEKDDTMVRASAKGVVTFSGYFSDRAGYGVSVDYGNGIVAKYKHSDRDDWRAPVGTVVEQGSPIMEIGMLGVGSTGYHLHHEIFKKGAIQTDANYWKYVDDSPEAYVGAASSAGNGNKPKKKEDDDMKIFAVDGSFYFATSRGIVGVRNTSELGVLRAFIASEPNKEPAFNAVQRDWINYYLTAPVLSWADLNPS